jgi:hypothetical protein
MHRGQPRDQEVPQPGLGIGGTPGEHERSVDLIGREFVRHRHAGRSASVADTAQSDLDHGGH